MYNFKSVVNIRFFDVFILRINSINRITSALFGFDFLSRDQVETFQIVGPILVYINSAINPTIYALSSQLYRKAFMEGLRSCRCRRSDKDDHNNSIGMTGISAISSTHASTMDGNGARNLTVDNSNMLWLSLFTLHFIKGLVTRVPHSTV